MLSSTDYYAGETKKCKVFEPEEGPAHLPPCTDNLIWGIIPEFPDHVREELEVAMVLGLRPLVPC